MAKQTEILWGEMPYSPEEIAVDFEDWCFAERCMPGHPTFRKSLEVTIANAIRRAEQYATESPADRGGYLPVQRALAAETA